MQFISRLEEASPIGPLISALVDEWDQRKEQRQLLLSLAYSNHVGPLDPEEVDKIDQPLNDICSPMIIREQALGCRDFLLYARDKVRSTSGLIRSVEELNRAEVLEDAQSNWLREDKLRAAVAAAIEATESVAGWANRAFVADLVRRSCSRSEIRQLIPEDLDQRRIAELCTLAENFAYGRTRSVFTAELSPALQVLAQVEVSRSGEPTKVLFVLNLEQVVALGMWRARGIQRLEAFETASSDVPTEPESDSGWATSSHGISYPIRRGA